MRIFAFDSADGGMTRIDDFDPEAPWSQAALPGGPAEVHGCAVLSSGELVIAERGGRVYVIDSDANFIQDVGTAPGIDPPVRPAGICLTADGSRLWLVDAKTRRILTGPVGGDLDTVLEPATTRLVAPYGVAALGDGIVVSDPGDGRVVALDSAGTPRRLRRSTGATPGALAVVGDDVIVTDVVTGQLRALTATSSRRIATAEAPGAIAAFGSDALVTIETRSRRLVLFTRSGADRWRRRRSIDGDRTLGRRPALVSVTALAVTE